MKTTTTLCAHGSDCQATWEWRARGRAGLSLGTATGTSIHLQICLELVAAAVGGPGVKWLHASVYSVRMQGLAPDAWAGNQGWGETRLLGRIFVAGNKSGLGAATRGTCSSSETILIVFLTLGLLTRDVCNALQIWRCPGLAVARSAFGGPQQLLFSSC